MGVTVGLLIDLSSLPESGDWKQHLKLIQETILERMVLDASFSGQFDVSDLVWTYKFYHSSYVFPHNKYWLKFLPFNVKEFDDFEVNMLNEMQSVYGGGPGPSSNFKDNIVQLREALKAMLSCLEWVEDIDIGRTSRNGSKQQRRSKFTTPHPEDMVQDSPSGQEIPFNRSTIYVFTRVPRSESDLESFLNNNSSGTSSDRIISALLGCDFYEHLKNKSIAQVKFVDTGYYFPNSDTDFNNVYPLPLQKALSSLGHVGCLVPTLKAYDHGRSGFPSWKSLLKNQMCSGANVGYNLLGLLKGRNNADAFPSRAETSNLQISSQPSMIMKRKYHGHSEQAERRSHRQSRQIQIRAAMSEQTRPGERSAYTAQKPLRQEKRLSSSRTQNSLHLAFEKSLRMELERKPSSNGSSKLRSYITAGNPKYGMMVAESKDVRTAEFVRKINQTYSFAAPSNPVLKLSPNKKARRRLFLIDSEEAELGDTSIERYRNTGSASAFRSPVAGRCSVSGNSPTTHRGDDFSSETSLNQFGIKNCSECYRIFEESNPSILKNCMHVKCRICFIEHSEGCLQCRNEAESERPKKALRSALTSSPSVSSTIFQTRKGPTPTAFGSSTQVAFPVTISTLIGQNAPPPGKATRSTTLRSTTNSNGSAAEPTNHSNFTIAPGTSKVHPSRRPPDPPSPPLQVLPKIRQTYGKTSATNEAPSPGAVPVQGHSGLNSTFTHINTESSSPAVSRTNGTAGPSTSIQQTKHVHAQVVTNGASTSSRSSTVSSASSGPTRYAEPTRIPPSSMPMPNPDAENEPEPDSILGNLNLDTAPNTENRASKKKRHPVHIQDHISIVSGDPALYQCNVCMKKFKTKAHVKYHAFCQNGEKPYRCGECGQGFIAKSHYEYHIRTHTGERPYVCPKCGKGFNQRGKVTRHMRSHTGEKPFVCQQCGRGFANAQAMRSHFLIHTGERPFACEFCDKRFTGMTNLKKHVITHTGERPFQCSHCGKSFGLKWTLDLHLRTHSSERPYACEQCSRAFSNSKDLRRHMVIHSGEKPFQCWICGTAFRRKDNLDRHIKSMHHREAAKEVAIGAVAEHLASSNSESSASASKCTTSSQALTPKPATASRAPAESKAAPPTPESSIK